MHLISPNGAARNKRELVLPFGGLTLSEILLGELLNEIGISGRLGFSIYWNNVSLNKSECCNLVLMNSAPAAVATCIVGHVRPGHRFGHLYCPVNIHLTSEILTN